ncbi:hypothetical protein LXL04_033085 [Taraxacum kok-saghyz]
MVMSDVAGDNKKRIKGKQKIKIKKIEDPNPRQVTFSKRRTGLFKKAAEICVLTGAQIAILVSSPSGRVYAFRHPNSDVLFDRYLNNDNKVATATNHTEPETASTENNQPPLPINEFNQHYVEVSRQVEAEKKRRETIPASSGWYNEPVNGLNAEELQAYLCSLGELKNKVLTRADELMMINKSGAFFSSNAYDIGWNENNINAPAFVSTNTAVAGGLNFHSKIDNATATFDAVFGIDRDREELRKKLNSEMKKVAGLAVRDRNKAVRMLSKNEELMVIFFTVEDEDKFGWVTDLLEDDM